MEFESLLCFQISPIAALRLARSLQFLVDVFPDLGVAAHHIVPSVLNLCARPGLSALASHRACSFGLKQMPPSLTRAIRINLIPYLIQGMDKTSELRIFELPY
jgi:hypothetical protein